MKIKRLDVPGWVTFEKLYYECVGDTRTELKENETIDEYYIRMMKFEGYNQCELYFPSDGYYLVDNNKVVIIFDGKAYSNVSDASVRRFKEDFEFVDAPSLSLEVMNSLKCLIHQGLINYKDKLHQLYSVNLLRNNQKKDILKHRMSLKMLNR